MKKVLLLAILSAFLFAFTGKPVIQHVSKPEGTLIVKKDVKLLATCSYTTSYYSSCQDAENAAHAWHVAHASTIIVNSVEDKYDWWGQQGVYYYSVVHYTAAHCIVNP